jgi:DNA uptake protein ComE-like DNA-binding protein
VGAGQLAFGLVDEASKINLNSASSNMLQGLVTALPRANQDLPAAILDWRSTNNTGTYQTYYATRSSPYQTKSAPFETVDELHLVYGGDSDTLNGEDANRNGILDPSEDDENRNGQLDSGVLEYLTVYSREPNTQSNGQPRINISLPLAPTGPLPTLLQTLFTSARANQIMLNLGLAPGPQKQNNNPPPPVRFTSPLQFFIKSKMTSDEFALVFNSITVTNGSFIEGRVNINTASAAVLTSLPGLTELGDTIVAYRLSNPDKLGSIGWIVDAIGAKDTTTLTALQRQDCLTTSSYQFSADVAAIGPNGRGFRRVRFVFDTLEGVPKIIYRQDLTQQGWALGKDIRQTWLFAQQTR